MNRRQLFTRLSAIALAPLVKWLPNDERQLSFKKGVVLVTSDGMWEWTPTDDSVQTITFTGPYTVFGQEEA